MTEPDARLRARRLALCVLLLSSAAILGALSVVGIRARQLFLQLDMTMLPAPTELVLRVSGLVGHPAGLAVAGLAALLACRLVWQGRADARLKRLTIATGVATALYTVLFVLSVYLPIVKIQQALQ